MKQTFFMYIKIIFSYDCIFVNKNNARQIKHSKQSHLSSCHRRQKSRISNVFLPQFREILFAHQKTCEKTGKYLEAEAVKKRLAKLKTEL